MADQTFAVHCGFFDAIDSDRTYSADEMNRPYRRVISNGVFATPQGNPSTDLQVVESTGMNIICKAGEGLFADKWFENPSSIVITVPDNTSTVPRIDSVLVQVDTRTSGRVGNIVHRTGTPASSPTPPAINQVEGVVEYRLANIRVNAGVTSILGRYITDRRGSSDCPWVTSLIYQVDTSTLYDQWQAAYAEYFEQEKAIWDAWYAQLTEDLDVSMTLDRHVNTVTTTAQTTGYIPIGLAYNHNTDILEVYINGLRAVEGTHYVVVDDTTILVENQLQIGQEVTFVVMRSVISGSATSIMTTLQSLEDEIAGIAGGTPTVVDAKADMTDHGKIYILSTDGKWYYYSTTASDWVIGGTYGGVPTDTTLTQEGMPADAKAVGDAVDALDGRVTAVEGDIGDLSDLTTTAKSDLVSAINEVAQSGGDITVSADVTATVTFTSNKGLIADETNRDFGSLTNSSLVKTSGYIFVGNALSVTLARPIYSASTTFGTVFYNASKVAIKGYILTTASEKSTETVTLDVPANAAYIRTCFWSSDTYGDFSISLQKSITDVFELDYDFENSGKGVVADSSLGDFGGLSTSSLLNATGYIHLSPQSYNGIRLTLPIYSSSTTFGAVFYKSDLTPIKGYIFNTASEKSTEVRTLPIPTGAVYLRTCFWSADTYGDFSIEAVIMQPPEDDGIDIKVYPSSYNGFVKDNDLKCTGTNDEAVIQAAINRVAGNGSGRVILAHGVYYIDSFVSVGDGDIPSALYMPADFNRVKIVCEEGIPRITASNDYVSAGNMSAVLKVTDTAYSSVSSAVSVIRAYKYSNVTRKSVLDIEGIAISIPNNQKPIIGIDGKNAQHMVIKNVRMCAIYNNTYQRPVANCIGIRGMQGSNDGIRDRWEDIAVYGFREGFAVSGEHLVCISLLARECFYGYTFNNFTNGLGAWTHPITMINCADELNENMPYFGHNGESAQTDGLGGRQCITMIDFNIEWLSSYHESDSGLYATEAQAGEWYGNISYCIQTGYGGNNKNVVNVPFWANGSGVNVKTENMAQKQIVTTSERNGYAPNEMQRVYDTTASKFYTYVNSAWVEG